MEAETERGTVCVTGASGYIGAWLVMRLLDQGYVVKATVRDPNNTKKVNHLLHLPKAKTHLTLWKAVLEDEGSFDEAIQGCTGVFHLASPVKIESEDPENEVIKPAINGILNVMRSCAKAKTVKRIVFTSSIAAVMRQEHPPPMYDESHWSDIDFVRRTKMPGWMYFASKTLAEKAAWEFAEQNNIDLISVIVALVVGPVIVPWMPTGIALAFALITGTECHYPLLKKCSFVHPDDLCNALVYLLEHPEVKGRYICSSHDSTISGLAKMLKEKFPEYYIPSKFEDVDESLEVVPFSSKKLQDLGFKYKYNLEDMYIGAIQSAREKDLIPLSTTKHTKDSGPVDE
ncbi:PREDICTED: bifunctional dihydroflavonol 4-reductase/flavanone 4-reductase-like [Nelumbo nucifera]|uniref:Flavanone 4-reductase n=2 Tax=Nelumbo nucifera TaxID=4432 RepID=A0A1U7Z533_NELNU|nr:PREDICTED: bifunctional dihydroflavonol 4-reductase/flavanone 4-reductase-like [Nelumbo nucifera]DAD39488.1 TPA_asm: hypothetical protein HUJ06_013811 [Nelumbo nucifera]